ncbi:LIC_10190 family membrane protein [Flavobacterium selenitireducens]|uniref:LIC_10190 family membrane protein n=1 Tax=Flavobacterium selenitireducens TaxID=2722704 RepID=UPI00168B888E|nr:hypothetical protein [Flavobacterium selenitireducens]MBD3581497.1 hypothetical protein [Flavobacterium selenitireducens]
MLLIALTFVYMVFTTVNFGACVNSLFKTRTSDVAIMGMLGLFGITMFTSAWAIFWRVNWEFHIALLAANIVLFFVFRNAVVAVYRLFRIRLGKLPESLRLLLLVNCLLILFKSASAPFVPDNESYYIQTVKWLNEFGLFKGLGNLHIFLSQMSGWHIGQSAFSFSFLYPNFNDLSGFCLLLANVYAIFRLHDYFVSGSKVALIMGVFPMANVFFLQFTAAPSPDIPIFVLTFMVIDIFFCHFENPSRSNFNLLAILVLFALYIKITAVAIAIFPIYLLATQFRHLLSKRMVSVGIGVLGLFVIRNMITSGVPLFPLPYDFGFHPDFAIPKHIAAYFFTESRPYSYGLTAAQFEAMPFYEIFWHWLRMPKLHGFFNVVAVALILISPMLIVRFFNIRPMWIAYCAMTIQLSLLLFLSPQYRFFVNFILFFGIFGVTSIVFKSRSIVGVSAVFSMLSAIVVFVPMRLGAVTDNHLTSQTPAFEWKRMLFPHPNSRSDGNFQKIRNGNLDYFSPVNDDFFWKTADGPLPCVNKDQIRFFERRFGVRPQLKGTKLADGFVSDTVR